MVTSPDAGEGELKLYGPAVQTAQNLRASAPERGGRREKEKEIVFNLHIGHAVIIDWE